VIHPDLWHPERKKRSVWDKVRKQVLEQHNYRCRFCGHRARKWMNIHHLHLKGQRKPHLVPACVACHAVLHIGKSFQHGCIEIWKSRISQREIVRRTREGIRRRKSLREIKASLPISRGELPPTSIEWAEQLLSQISNQRRSNQPSISLKRPYCAVFVKLKRWQLGEERHRERVKQITERIWLAFKKRKRS
jgi:hypothetical protein